MPYRTAAEMPPERKASMKEKLTEIWESIDLAKFLRSKSKSHVRFFFQMLIALLLVFTMVGLLGLAVGMVIVFGVWLHYWSIPVIILWIPFCITIGRAAIPWFEKTLGE